MFGDRKEVPIRYHSMFLKTVIALCVLMLANGIVFYLFLTKLYEEKFIQKQSAAGFFSMSQYASELSSVVSGGMSQLDNLFQTQDCRRLIISGEELPESQYTSVMHDLASLVSEHSYLNSAMLYLRHIDRLLVSDRTITDAASSGIEEVLDSGTSGLVTYKGDMYLCRVYPAKKPVAVMVCEIDPKLFYDNIAVSNVTGNGISHIFVYDIEGAPLFANSMKYPDAEEIKVEGEIEDLTEEENCRAFRSGDKYTLVYEDTENHLIYLQLLDAFSGLTFREFMSRAALVVVADVVFLLAASYYLLNRVFTPFSNALSEMISTKDPDKIEELRQSSSNEVDLIKNIALVEEQQQQMRREMMQSAHDTIQATVMGELIAGTGRNQAEVKSIMKDIESPFPINGRYFVVVYYCEPHDNGSADSIREELVRLETEALAKEFWEGRALVRMLPARDKHSFIVLCLNDAEEDSDCVAEYCARLNQRLSNYNSKSAAGMSHEGRSLFDLRELGEEALIDMRNRIYYAEEGGRKTESSEEAEIMTQATQTFERMMNLDNPELYYEEENTLQALFAGVILRQPEQAGAIFSKMTDIMMEKMIQAHLPVSEQEHMEREFAIRSNEPWEADGARVDALCRFFDLCLGDYQRSNNNDKFRYVDSAMKLIQQRYYDNTLSLESISSELGLSPQYLSRLFASRQTEGFLNYLNRYRLDRAKELLAHTDFSISDVGLKTGFNSSPSFIRVFKRYEHMTPGQYRRQAVAGERPDEEGTEYAQGSQEENDA